MTYPVCWMPRGLHATPVELRRQLQEAIDRYTDEYDTILLGYCLCGGSLEGIQARRSRLAAMNCYDCVNMLMKDEGVDRHSLYFTAGWIRSDDFIGKEYDRVLERRGPEKTKRVYRRILQGYDRMLMMDTGAYDLRSWEAEARAAAEKLELRYEEGPASLEALQKLLTHHWDENILVVEPGGLVKSQ